MIETNIRGKNQNWMKGKTTDDLHECLDCEGCLCEEVCREYEEENFGKKEGE